MNSFLSVKRIKWSIQRLVAEEKRNFLVAFGILLVVNLLMLVGLSSLIEGKRIVKYEDIRLATFVINIFVISFMSYHGYSKKMEKEEYAIHSCMIPNSAFENCLIRVLYLLIYMGIILIALWLADWYTLNYTGLKKSIVENGYQMPKINFLDFKYTSFLTIFFILSMLGFSWLNHKKNNFRSLIATLGIFLLFSINWVLNALFFLKDGIINPIRLPFTSIKLENPTFNRGNFYVISSGINNNQILLYYLLPIALWCVFIYYFKLKEQEL